MTKSKTINLIEQELVSKLGIPKLEFLNKLSEKELILFRFHLVNSIEEQRHIGLRLGLEVAKDEAKKKGNDLILPDSNSIKIRVEKK